LAEFFAGNRLATVASSAEDPGVELDVTLEMPTNLPAETASTSAKDSGGSFAFLSAVPSPETARVLAREGAQTIAVVLAQLDSSLAAELLELLPSHLATDTLERMAWLIEPAADVLADIERQLRLELTPFLTGEDRPHSLASMQALLSAMDAAPRERVLAGLGQRNARLARQLGYDGMEHAVTASRFRVERQSGEPLEHATIREIAPIRSPSKRPVPLVEFDDLLTLSDEALRRIFAAADSKVVLLALTGAPESLLVRILGQLPASDAATLRRRLNHPGAMRLSDIEAAQEQLTDVARQLAEDGVIVLPGFRHFAAAA
jgi:flagellar motor switch protein FliG